MPTVCTSPPCSCSADRGGPPRPQSNRSSMGRRAVELTFHPTTAITKLTDGPELVVTESLIARTNGLLPLPRRKTPASSGPCGDPDPRTTCSSGLMRRPASRSGAGNPLSANNQAAAPMPGRSNLMRVNGRPSRISARDAGPGAVGASTGSEGKVVAGPFDDEPRYGIIWVLTRTRPLAHTLPLSITSSTGPPLRRPWRTNSNQNPETGRVFKTLHPPPYAPQLERRAPAPSNTTSGSKAGSWHRCQYKAVGSTPGAPTSRGRAAAPLGRAANCHIHESSHPAIRRLGKRRGRGIPQPGSDYLRTVAPFNGPPLGQPAKDPRLTALTAQPWSAVSAGMPGAKVPGARSTWARRGSRAVPRFEVSGAPAGRCPQGPTRRNLLPPQGWPSRTAPPPGCHGRDGLFPGPPSVAPWYCIPRALRGPVGPLSPPRRSPGPSAEPLSPAWDRRERPLRSPPA